MNVHCSVNEKQYCTHWKQQEGSYSLNFEFNIMNRQILHLKSKKRDNLEDILLNTLVIHWELHTQRAIHRKRKYTERFHMKTSQK